MNKFSNLLNCENIEMTEESLIEIFKFDLVEMISLSNKFKIMDINSFKEYLMSKYTIPDQLECYFHHFTSTLNVNSFEYGLLTLNKVYIQLLNDLYSYLKDFISITEWEEVKQRVCSPSLNRGRTTAFSRINDKEHGPYGFLIKEFGLEERSDVYYLECSEYIEDIFRNTNFIFKGLIDEAKIREIYNENKKHVVVTFSRVLNNPNEIAKWIAYAFQYVYYKRNTSDINWCNAAYDNQGIDIERDDIKYVQII